MNSFIKLTFIISLTAIFISCKSKKEINSPDTGMILPKIENSKNSETWVAVFFGKLPCADCSGINTQITLNKDLTYSMIRTYQDKKGSFKNFGKFEWNEKGTEINLHNINEGGAFQHYIFQDDKLILLSPQGEIFEKEDMESVILKKINTDFELTGKYWKLIELNGNLIDYNSEIPTEAHILFNPDGTFSGSLSCNRISGTFSTENNFNIKFSQLIMTKKLCIDMSIENELVKIFNTTDNYSIKDNQLSISRARMTPLARFEVVYMN
ncbi:MAG: copper resistance protein NlpE N-terminal domain-containing protein [Bacteroidales bacterium]|jgi:heat shock protein HslJ|nr:copper resistance protein NlpE N-terminal domain-containing protein [Bacteroidales bacterium]